MATQDERKHGIHTAQDAQISETSPLIRFPALLRGAEWLIRLFLGALLAQAQIFGEWSPFGLAFVAASGSGVGGVCALVGTSLGYVTSLGLVGGLRYVAAAVLIFSVAFAFFDLPFMPSGWFMPLVAAMVDGGTGLLYYADTPWTATQVIYFLSEVVLTGGLAYFYRIAFSAWQRRGETALTSRQMVSGLILGGTLLITLAGVPILGDVISLGRMLAALGIMVLASQGGVTVGAAVGIGAGLCIDMAGGIMGETAVAFGLSGLVTGLFRGQSKTICGVAYVLTNAIVVLWGWNEGIQLGLLYEVFGASVLFLLVPKKATNWVSALFSGEGEAAVADRSATHMRGHLADTAQAFARLHQLLGQAFRPQPHNDEDTAAIFDRTAGKVCRRCALRETCWQRDYVTTYNALNDALTPMMERGRGEPKDFPRHFSNRCLKFTEFVGAANEELAGLFARRQYRVQLRESRGAVCRQYETLASVLGEASRHLSTPLPLDEQRGKKLNTHLATMGVEGTGYVFRDAQGHLQVEVEGQGLELLQGPGVRKRLSRLMDVPLRPAVYREGEWGEMLVFSQGEPLAAITGQASLAKRGESVNGDNGNWFRRHDGVLFLMLCDGMGSGAQADRESATTINLLEGFLRAGVATKWALQTLNTALALRCEEEGGFSTLDLMEVNLFTGETTLYKYGGGPTYIRQGGKVRKICGASLPLGVADGENVNPDMTRLQLSAGDAVALVSDGLLAGDSDQWLQKSLTGWKGGTSKELATTLVEHPEGLDEDDRTALVLQLRARELN